jgi:hypothetical protein
LISSRRSTEIDPDHRRLGQPQRGERAIHELRLRRDPEVGVEGPIRLAVAEQVDGECGPVRQGDLGSDASPEEAGGAEAVEQHDRRPAMTVALDVHRARSDGNPQHVSVDWGVLALRVARACDEQKARTDAEDAHLARRPGQG